jgi:hypothetical protein
MRAQYRGAARIAAGLRRHSEERDFAYDGLCERGEDCGSCPSDCAGQETGKPANRYRCGDGIPQSAEGEGNYWLGDTESSFQMSRL